MPVPPPTKPPEPPPDKIAEKKPSRFQAEMPQIPGVAPGSASSAGRGSSGPDMQLLLQIGGIAAIVAMLGGIIFWWAVKPRGVAKTASPDGDTTQQSAPAPPLPDAAAPAPGGPTIAATVEELSKPWSAKKFTYTDSVTYEKTPAMVIRIPGGELWAFSLQGPLSRCQLEYVTDLAALASQFEYRATHPMVVNPCDKTVYDPLKVGALGGNTWARGEIVQGSALRPPISIDVRVSGRSILADKIE